MRIGAAGSDTLELSVTGYQFPLAPDPRLRYSWHTIWGRACTAHETWDFHGPALTCDESVRLTSWLRRAADEIDLAGLAERVPPVLLQERFTEPNLAFDLVDVRSAQDASLRVDLDLEFRAPSNRRARGAGSPSTLQLRTSAQQLRLAATDWSDEVARFPDLAVS